MANERILVVEDEPRVAQALCRVLTLPEGGGYEVERCDSAEAALERLPRGRFDLLVTDLSMPGLSGLDLLPQVRELSPKTRTILITAYGTAEVERRAKGLADAYIPKPFTMKSFVRTVEEILAVRPEAPICRSEFSTRETQTIRARIDLMRLDLGALGVMVLDPEGHIVAECGQHPDLDTGSVLNLLGTTMVHVNKLVQVLDEADAFNLNLHQGKRYDIYTGRINSQAFICLVLDHASQSASPFGMVWLSLRRAISDLRELLAKSSTTASSVQETMRPVLPDLDRPPASKARFYPPAPTQPRLRHSARLDAEPRPVPASVSTPNPSLAEPTPAESTSQVSATSTRQAEPSPAWASTAQAEIKPQPTLTETGTPVGPPLTAPADTPSAKNVSAPVDPLPRPTATANPESPSASTSQYSTEPSSAIGQTDQPQPPVKMAALGQADQLFTPESVPEAETLLSYDEAVALGILKTENLPAFLLPPDNSPSD